MWFRPEYFAALSIPLIHGAKFSSYDGAEKPRVVLVNEAFVTRVHFRAEPARTPHSNQLQNGELNPGGALSEIVGVVRDVRQSSLEIAPEPQIYLSRLQYGLEGGGYVIRVTRDEADSQLPSQRPSPPSIRTRSK